MVILKWNFRLLCNRPRKRWLSLSPRGQANSFISGFSPCSFSGVFEKFSLVARLVDCFPVVFLPGPHPGFYPVCKSPHLFLNGSSLDTALLHIWPSCHLHPFDHSEATFSVFLCGRNLLLFIWNCYWTKVRVWLPVVTNRQILEAEDGEKIKRSLFKCFTVWENGRLLSQEKPIPSRNLEENPAALSQTKAKGSVQFVLPFQVWHVPWELQADAEWSSRQASASLLRTRVWGRWLHWPRGFQGQKVLQTHQPVCLQGEQESVSLPSPGFLLGSCVGWTRWFS